MSRAGMGVQGAYDKAIADYNVALRLAPKETAFYRNRANLWITVGVYDKAVEDCNRTRWNSIRNWRRPTSTEECWFQHGELTRLSTTQCSLELDSNACGLPMSTRTLAVSRRTTTIR